MVETEAKEDAEMAALHTAKQQLRSAMKKRLGAISQESVTLQSSAVFNTLRSLKPYVEANRVSIFLSMPNGEIQTDSIVRHALGSGKEVFIPYLYRPDQVPSDGFPSRVMDMVRLRDLEDYEALKRDKWGIPSISSADVRGRERALGGQGGQDSKEALLDLVLMPGVAFDLSPDDGAIRRLGHGRGFYDHFVNRYKAKAISMGLQETSVSLYGLALSEQFLATPSEGSVPVGTFDQPLDGLILGNGEVKIPRDKQ